MTKFKTRYKNPYTANDYKTCWAGMIKSQKEVEEIIQKFSNKKIDEFQRLAKKLVRKNSIRMWLNVCDEITNFFELDENPVRRYTLIPTIPGLLGLMHVTNTIFLSGLSSIRAWNDNNKWWNSLNLKQTQMVIWTENAQKLLNDAPDQVQIGVLKNQKFLETKILGHMNGKFSGESEQWYIDIIQSNLGYLGNIENPLNYAERKGTFDGHIKMIGGIYSTLWATFLMLEVDRKNYF